MAPLVPQVILQATYTSSVGIPHVMALRIETLYNEIFPRLAIETAIEFTANGWILMMGGLRDFKLFFRSDPLELDFLDVAARVRPIPSTPSPRQEAWRAPNKDVPISWELSFVKIPLDLPADELAEMVTAFYAGTQGLSRGSCRVARRENDRPVLEIIQPSRLEYLSFMDRLVEQALAVTRQFDSAEFREILDHLFD